MPLILFRVINALLSSYVAHADVNKLTLVNKTPLNILSHAVIIRPVMEIGKYQSQFFTFYLLKVKY